MCQIEDANSRLDNIGTFPYTWDLQEPFNMANCGSQIISCTGMHSWSLSTDFGCSRTPKPHSWPASVSTGRSRGLAHFGPMQRGESRGKPSFRGPSTRPGFHTTQNPPSWSPARMHQHPSPGKAALPRVTWVSKMIKGNSWKSSETSWKPPVLLLKMWASSGFCVSTVAPGLAL